MAQLFRRNACKCGHLKKQHYPLQHNGPGHCMIERCLCQKFDQQPMGRKRLRRKTPIPTVFETKLRAYQQEALDNITAKFTPAIPAFL